MVDQSQILSAPTLRGRGRVNVQAGKGEDAGLLPLVDGSLVLGVPHQIRLVGGTGSILRSRDIVVWTTNLVLGTIATVL